MNALITYKTITGNTKKMAKAIEKGVDGTFDSFEMIQVDNTDEYDILFIGFPIMNRRIPEGVKEFIKEKAKNKKVVLYISHAMPKELPHLQTLITKACEVANNTELLGVFNCQGELSEELAVNLKKHENEEFRRFGSLRHESIGLPSENDLEELIQFTKNIIKESK